MKLTRKKFLTIYAAIIIGALIYIIFIAPSSFFTHHKTNKVTEIELQDNYQDIMTQLDHLINGTYDYDYNILDSIGDKSVMYICSGKKSDIDDVGACTKPKKITYNLKNKNDNLNGLNHNLLDIAYIKNLIDGKDPTIKKYEKTRYLTFKEIKIDDLDTDISIMTNYDEIEQIEITNGYETYVIKYSNIAY